MDWMKKHVDTVVVLGGIVGALVWMNGKFDDTNEKFNAKFYKLEQDIALVNKDIALINKEIAIMKTVMIMKNIMPHELAVNEQIKE